MGLDLTTCKGSFLISILAIYLTLTYLNKKLTVNKIVDKFTITMGDYIHIFFIFLINVHFFISGPYPTVRGGPFAVAGIKPELTT